MIYALPFEGFPAVRKFYTVTRNTVWQISEPENLLIFLQEGSCRFFLYGEEHTLSAGDVIFIPASVQYTRRPAGDTLCTMTYVHFDLCRPARELNAEEAAREVALLQADVERRILSGSNAVRPLKEIYIENVYAPDGGVLWHTRTEGIRLFSSHRSLTCGLESAVILAGILSRMSRLTLERLPRSRELPDAPKVPAKLKEALRYVSEHYSERITLADLAAYCHLTPQQLTRCFHSTLHTTPNKYITECKIARAKKLLFYDTQLTVKEIAAELGFDNQHYFTRVFTRVTGETPTAYRERTVHYSPDTDRGTSPDVGSPTD